MRAIATACIASALALMTFVVSPTGAATLSDDFNDNRVDLSKWRTDIPTTNFQLWGDVTNARVVEQNQRLEITDRAYLVTRNQFVPGPNAPLTISGTVTFVDTSAPNFSPFAGAWNAELFSISTRSTAARRNGSWGEAEGLCFQMGCPAPSPDGAVPYISIQEYIGTGSQKSSSATTYPNSHLTGLAEGDTVAFTITDDGHNASFDVAKLVDGVASATIHDHIDFTTDYTSGGNYVAFWNREVQGPADDRTSALDDVTISGLPEPAALGPLIPCAVMLLGRRPGPRARRHDGQGRAAHWDRRRRWASSSRFTIYAMISRTTFPCTSVSRKSRPA